MTDKHDKTPGKAHDKAHDKAEHALDKMIEGDRREGERMLEEARKMDGTAVDDVGREVEEERKQAEKYRDEK